MAICVKTSLPGDWSVQSKYRSIGIDPALWGNIQININGTDSRTEISSYQPMFLSNNVLCGLLCHLKDKAVDKRLASLSCQQSARRPPCSFVKP